MNHVPRLLDLQPAPSAFDFTAAMRGVAGAVSVITVADGSEINGMTVTSVSSFSVDPPSMLVSINQSASSYPTLRKTGTFGINVLGAQHREIAEHFSGRDGLKGAARFAGAKWERGVTGVPLLIGAAATFDCTVEDIIERHSHAVVIGRVCSVVAERDIGAMVYRHSAYIPMPQKADEYLWY